jgi:hypothetical protein
VGCSQRQLKFNSASHSAGWYLNSAEQSQQRAILVDTILPSPAQ